MAQKVRRADAYRPRDAEGVGIARLLATHATPLFFKGRLRWEGHNTSSAPPAGSHHWKSAVSAVSRPTAIPAACASISPSSRSSVIKPAVAREWDLVLKEINGRMRAGSGAHSDGEAPTA